MFHCTQIEAVNLKESVDSVRTMPRVMHASLLSLWLEKAGPLAMCPSVLSRLSVNLSLGDTADWLETGYMSQILRTRGRGPSLGIPVPPEATADLLRRLSWLGGLCIFHGNRAGPPPRREETEATTAPCNFCSVTKYQEPAGRNPDALQCKESKTRAKVQAGLASSEAGGRAAPVCPSSAASPDLHWSYVYTCSPPPRLQLPENDLPMSLPMPSLFMADSAPNLPSDENTCQLGLGLPQMTTFHYLSRTPIS